MSIHRAVEILEAKSREIIEYASQFRGDKDAQILLSDLGKKAKSYMESALVLKSSPEYLAEIAFQNADYHH
jgi:hypothetical protein